MTTEIYTASKQAPGAKQRAFVLELLRQGPQTTNAFRQAGVLSPAARIMELKEIGHHIVKEMVLDESHDGRRHRVAEYALLLEASNG